MINKKRAMKPKSIKKVLRNKINHFAESIKDQDLRNLVKEHAIVTGGAIPSMWEHGTPEAVNDYDIYFDSANVALKIAQYYTKLYLQNHRGIFDHSAERMWVKFDKETNRIRIMIASEGIAEDDNENSEYVEERMVNLHTRVKQAEKENKKDKENKEDKEDKKYQPVFLTSNAITLTGRVQLIFRFFGTPEEIHKNYDFVHCTSYYHSGEDNLFLRPEAIISIDTKELIYQGSLYPVCSLIRLRKFLSRGWTINAGQILKMAFQISELDLSDKNVLADQLIGVDVAYFIQLLSMIKSKDSKEINSTYIAKLIDKIF